ncbi:MAG TPA: CapA family protein, partial [Thermoanaerobaculia bacterium]|nr:CapA family protein [Thermoanaerobaculia bacterium]
PPFAATSQRAGTNFLDIEAEKNPAAILFPMAAACHSFGADIAVLSLHWGPNMVTEPPHVFREFAHAAIDAGFDVIHGHSAHLFQGIEIYRERPIFYDTGDFIDDYAVDEVLRNDWPFIFLIDVAGGWIERVRVAPVRLNFARVDLAEGEERNAIVARMQQACSALGTKTALIDGGLQILIDQPALAG